ncbi:hypothetical protein V501_05286 [Pseudogymnoascus sp. VKM F-4519 (FW-2642)]|nr:hypothetical protein V501_05286 [Pseudogymnoascus sp. VKM F-4519 (FW-2642)]
MARQDLYNQRGSYSDHSDSIAPHPSYASDNAWMHTRSDSHGPNAALRGPTPPDVFSKLSAAIPDLRPLDSGARAATRAEQKITFLGGCRLYPKAMAWSMAISSTIIMEGFDTLLIFSFFSHPTFRRAYGVSTGNGNYEIPTRWQFALPTAAEAGEIVGLLLSGVVADRIGYRFTLAAALIFLFLSVFLSFFATLSINYAAEVMPVTLRGYLLANINLCWVWGQLLATGIVKALVNNSSQWSYRLPFALQWVIGVPVFIAVLLAPESPWWLIRDNRLEAAKSSLLRLTTKGTVNVNETAAVMTYTNEVEKYLNDKPSIAYLDCFKRSDLRRTEIACVVWVTQQVCGTSLLGWAAYFYEQAGLQTNDAFSLSVGTYGLAVVGNVVSWFLLRRVGRRRLYLSGLLTMLITLLAIGGVGVAPTSRGQSWTLGSLLLVLTFIYHLTIGPVCFVLVAEIPSTRLRVKTAVLARVAYNLAGILINWMTPRMLSPTAWNWKGTSGFFFAGTTFLCLVYCYWRLPETLGLSYLEIDVLFERKAKVSKFRELQINLDSLGYFSMDRAERDQLPFRAY